jgi:hypothetical protein
MIIIKDFNSTLINIFKISMNIMYQQTKIKSPFKYPE